MDVMTRISFFVAFLALLCTTANAQRSVQVAVISDGDQYQFAQVAQIFKDELNSLTAGEFAIEYKEYKANWTQDSINQAYDQAYADKEIDLVLGLGFTGNQIAVSRKTFPKPTFLPIVFDSELAGAPSRGNTSGKRNLSYLAERVSIEEELRTYQRIVAFRHVTVIIDQVIFDAVPRIPDFLVPVGKRINTSITFVRHDGENHNFLNQIPSDTDAVIYTGLPRLPDKEFDAMIEGFIQRGLPSFSLSDRDPVVRGMLAADTVDTDWQRLGRRNALNIQAVLLGEKVQDQPVFFKGKQELTINMQTARRLGLSPRFDILSEATLLNEEPEPSGPALDLKKVAVMALQANLDLKAEALNAATGAEDIKIARSSLFPQISLSSSRTQRRVSPNVEAGLFPEKTLDGSIALNQTIYSDDSYSGLSISRYSQSALDAGLASTQLDIVQQATQAYVDVLRAQNQLKIQQQNLELTKSNLDLARDRVRIGSSSKADVYRWESDLASARSQVLQARAVVDQSKETLNRLLNRPITEPFQLLPAAARDPFAITTQQFDLMVNNPRSYGWVVDFLVSRGLASSPELAQLDSLIAAKNREIVNQRRDFWLPDFALSSQNSDNFNQSGLGAGGLTDGASDWSVSLNASIPLYAGGRRKAELSRSRLELERLKTQRQAQSERIEEQIRAAMHALNASYANIDLSKESATAARLNLELVTDSYAGGTVSILELLDAQNQSLSAQLSAENAVYDFLTSALATQRASARYDFLLDPEDQAVAIQILEDYLNQRQTENSKR